MNSLVKITAAGLAAVALSACFEEPGSDMAVERGLEGRGFVVVDDSQSDSGLSSLWRHNRQSG